MSSLPVSLSITDIGIIVGASAASLIIIIILVVVCYRRYKRRQSAKKQPAQSTSQKNSVVKSTTSRSSFQRGTDFVQNHIHTENTNGVNDDGNGDQQHVPLGVLASQERVRQSQGQPESNDQQSKQKPPLQLNYVSVDSLKPSKNSAGQPISQPLTQLIPGTSRVSGNCGPGSSHLNSSLPFIYSPMMMPAAIVVPDANGGVKVKANPLIAQQLQSMRSLASLKQQQAAAGSTMLRQHSGSTNNSAQTSNMSLPMATPVQAPQPKSDTGGPIEKMFMATMAQYVIDSMEKKKRKKKKRKQRKTRDSSENEEEEEEDDEEEGDEDAESGDESQTNSLNNTNGHVRFVDNNHVTKTPTSGQSPAPLRRVNAATTGSATSLNGTGPPKQAPSNLSRMHSSLVDVSKPTTPPPPLPPSSTKPTVTLSSSRLAQPQSPPSTTQSRSGSKPPTPTTPIPTKLPEVTFEHQPPLSPPVSTVPGPQTTLQIPLTLDSTGSDHSYHAYIQTLENEPLPPEPDSSHSSHSSRSSRSNGKLKPNHDTGTDRIRESIRESEPESDVTPPSPSIPPNQVRSDASIPIKPTNSARYNPGRPIALPGLSKSIAPPVSVLTRTYSSKRIDYSNYNDGESHGDTTTAATAAAVVALPGLTGRERQSILTEEEYQNQYNHEQS